WSLHYKHDIWHIALTLSKICHATHELLKLNNKDPKHLFEGNTLICCLIHISM
ncbi:hypothetical protein EDD85DRAFT_726845, partial [Armillaria nabsnona]